MLTSMAFLGAGLALMVVCFGILGFGFKVSGHDDRRSFIKSLGDGYPALCIFGIIGTVVFSIGFMTSVAMLFGAE